MVDLAARSDGAGLGSSASGLFNKGSGLGDAFEPLLHVRLVFDKLLISHISLLKEAVDIKDGFLSVFFIFDGVDCTSWSRK